MKNKNFNQYTIYFLVLVFVALFTTGCSTKSQVDTGLQFSDAYIQLHGEYLDIYNNSDEKTQQYMRSKVAPIMNQLKKEIIDYNDIVMSGGEGSAEKRNAIMNKLRTLPLKFMEVK